MIDFKGKTILVTGGGGLGIGNGIARILSKFGATVVLNDINEEVAQKGAQNVPNAVPYGADLRDQNRVSEMFRDIFSRFGTIDGLVNNAGVGNASPAHETNNKTFDFLYSLDVKSVWYLSKLFAQYHIANKTSGNIVNISSVQSVATQDGYGLYASAKSAVEGLTRGMAVELGKYNIRVNAIAPGYIATNNTEALRNDPDRSRQILERIPAGRWGEPGDIGDAAVFLASPAAKYIHGTILNVDGGWLAR